MQLPSCSTLQHYNIIGMKFLLLHVYLLGFPIRISFILSLLPLMLLILHIDNEKIRWILFYFFRPYMRSRNTCIMLWEYLVKVWWIFASKRKLRLHRRKKKKRIWESFRYFNVCCGLTETCFCFAHLHSLWVFYYFQLKKRCCTLWHWCSNAFWWIFMIILYTMTMDGNLKPFSHLYWMKKSFSLRKVR